MEEKDMRFIRKMRASLIAVLLCRQKTTYRVNKTMTWKTNNHTYVAPGFSVFYLCFLQPFEDGVCGNRTVRGILITTSSKVSVFATVSLKTNFGTRLTGSKKGEEIFHPEIVHLIFLPVKTETWRRASVNNVMWVASDSEGKTPSCKKCSLTTTSVLAMNAQYKKKKKCGVSCWENNAASFQAMI